MGKGSDLGGEIAILEAEELSLEPASDSGVFTALRGQQGTPEVQAESAVKIQPVIAARFCSPHLWQRRRGRGVNPGSPCRSPFRVDVQSLRPPPRRLPSWPGTWMPTAMLWDERKGLMKDVLWEASQCCRCRLVSEWHCSSFREQKAQRGQTARWCRPRLSQT